MADTIKLFLIGLPVPVYLQLSLEALKLALDQRLILMRIGTNFGPPTKLLTMRFGLPVSSIHSVRGRSSKKKMDISMRARNMRGIYVDHIRSRCDGWVCGRREMQRDPRTPPRHGCPKGSKG